MNTKEEVLRYINSCETPGALLLSGKWGCGKSYLMREEIAKEVNAKGKSYICIISLFGVDSISVLNQCVKEAYLAASSGFFTKTVRKATKAIGNLMKNGAEITSASVPSSGAAAGVAKGLGSLMSLNYFQFVPVKNEFGKKGNKRKFVIAFDDLERCKIDTVELLGAINEYCENKKIKTIIIANEEQIESEDFSSFKEKVVFQTIKLTANHEEIIDGIIENYKETEEGYVKFLQKNTDKIRYTFKASGYDNLRTVKAIFACFERVYGAFVKGRCEKVLLGNLFYNFSVLYFEAKANNYHEDAYGDLFASEKLQKKYSDYGSFYSLDSLRKWIIEGTWDESAFLQEIEYKFSQKIQTPEEKFLKYDFWALDDNIIKQALPGILVKAESGELSFDDYISFIRRMALLKSRGITIPVEVDYKKVKSGLGQLVSKIKEGTANEKEKFSFVPKDEVKKLSREEQDIILLIEYSSGSKPHWETRRDFLNCLNGTNKNSLSSYYNRILICFDDELMEAFFNCYKRSSNSQKRDLYLLLSEFNFAYTGVARESDLETTISNLEKLIKKLKELLKTETDSFARYVINATIENIPSVIRKVEMAQGNTAD